MWILQYMKYPIEEILGQISSKGISTESQNSEESLQHRDVPAFDIGGNYLRLKQCELDNGSKSHGTRGKSSKLQAPISIPFIWQAAS